MYFELWGKRYHHRHSLTDFILFSVDTSDKIKLPEVVPRPVENQKPQQP
jgi:hypothetical protein